MTIFMPIIGYMILFNDDLIKYFRLSDKFVWNETGERLIPERPVPQDVVTSGMQ
jgi:hypothetical protein